MNDPKIEVYKNLSQNDINDIFVKACRDNDLPTVEYLLTSSEIAIRAEINAKDAFGSVGLCAAIASRSTEVAKFLMTSPKLSDKADIHINDESPFYYSVVNENKDLIELFIFDLNIEKTKLIIDYMADFDDDGYAEKLFAMRELTQELEKNLSTTGKIQRPMKV